MPRWKLSSRERATVDPATCGFKISDKRKGKVHTHGGTKTSGKYHVDVKDRLERDPRGRKSVYESDADRQRAYRIRKELRGRGLEGDELKRAVKSKLRQMRRYRKFDIAMKQRDELERLDESLHFYDEAIREGNGGPQWGTDFDADDTPFMSDK